MTKKTVGEHANVILHARWELIGTEGTTGTEGRFIGATPIDFDSGSVDEFVAFGDLTRRISNRLGFIISNRSQLDIGTTFQHKFKKVLMRLMMQLKK